MAKDQIKDDTSGKTTITLDGDKGDITLGGGDHYGDLFLKAKSPKGDKTIHLGGAGNIWVGAKDHAGGVYVFPDDSPRENTDRFKATIRLEGEFANIWAGRKGQGGSVILFPSTINKADTSDKASVFLDGENGNITLGGKMSETDGDIFIKNKNGDTTIHLDGDAGDIILNSADCAEEFDVSDPEKIEPGTVMVLDGEGKLQPSTQAYDKKVTGVVSGAGEYKPGIVLDRKRSQKDRVPVALMGKVYCKVDAQYSAIEVGDLLTTSPTPGHAMKANDPLKAFGTVIGKAMRTLESGQGLIPMLIALQ